VDSWPTQTRPLLLALMVTVRVTVAYAQPAEARRDIGVAQGELTLLCGWEIAYG
jgi:hypothetical protein